MSSEAQSFEPIEQLLERLNVNSVFGTPTQAGSITLIPVAQVSIGFGYGSGSGPTDEDAGTGRPSTVLTRDAETGGREPSARTSTGAGGGGGGRARPLGFIRAAPDGVQFEPIVDVPRLSIAGIFLAGWTVFWVARTITAFQRGR